MNSSTVKLVALSLLFGVAAPSGFAQVGAARAGGGLFGIGDGRPGDSEASLDLALAPEGVDVGLAPLATTSGLDTKTLERYYTDLAELVASRMLSLRAQRQLEESVPAAES